MALQAAYAASHPIAIRKIHLRDLVDALDQGIADFKAKPTHLVFLAIIYPAATLFAFLVIDNVSLMPLVFPILSGMVLIGPFIGLGLEEFSRHREQGLDMSWTHAFNFFESPAFADALVLGLLVIGLFLGWVAAANTIYLMTLGDAWSAQAFTAQEFLKAVFTTHAGWTMIILGNVTGFLFAVAALCIGVISFPMVLDRRGSVGTAVETSVRAVIANPIPMAVWGLFVGFSLLVGAVPFLVGLAIVIPILGHSTWHLYRKIIA